MRRFPLAFVVSVLLHVGLLLLAYISWKDTPKPIAVVSVPVELVSNVPSRQQAEAPVDKLAVKTPQPIPAPEETPKPTPPTPTPPLPVPTPQKAVVPNKVPEPKPVPLPKPPEPKPVPKPADQAPPDKNGVKKPVPPEKAKPAPAKPALDLDSLAQAAAAPSKAPTRTLPQANTHRTTGISSVGQGPSDAGVVDAALNALTSKLGHIWAPNCDVPGGNKVDLHLLFVISPGGRVVSGPQWLNPKNDPVWEAAATRAKAAVKQGELYDNLPAGAYNKPLDIEFDAKTVCKDQ